MEGCASRQKILVLDCCYSGAFPASGLKGDAEVHALERFRGRGRTVLTASDALRYSFEGAPIGDTTQSVFTRHLVAGLRDGSADLDGDGNITVDELYNYVYDRVVEEEPRQRPKKQDDIEGRTVIARNVCWTLPAYLRNSLNSPIATDRLSAIDGLRHLFQIGNDNVRGRVLAEIERLVVDDSRSVSEAAAASLRALWPMGAKPAEPAQAAQRNAEEAPSPAVSAAVPVGLIDDSGGGPDAPSVATGQTTPPVPVGGPIAKIRGLAAGVDGPNAAARVPRLSCIFLAVAYVSWGLSISTYRPQLGWCVLGGAVVALACALIERQSNRRWLVAVVAAFPWCALGGGITAASQDVICQSGGVYVLAALANLGIFVANGGILPVLGIVQSGQVGIPRRRLLYA